jgi:hypothetical protein
VVASVWSKEVEDDIARHVRYFGKHDCHTRQRLGQLRPLRFASLWTYVAGVYNQIKGAKCRDGIE